MAKIGRFLDKLPEPMEDLLERTCPFRKHKGETWRQVLDEDPKYVEWLLFDADDIEFEPTLRDELIWALEDM